MRKLRGTSMNILTNAIISLTARLHLRETFISENAESLINVPTMILDVMRRHVLLYATEVCFNVSTLGKIGKNFSRHVETFSPGNRIIHLMEIVSNSDTLHEM